MTSLVVDLPESLDRLVKDQVASGAYPDAAAVVREGLARLLADSDDDAGQAGRLRAKIQVGVDQLDRGEGIPIADVKSWLDGLGRGRRDDAAA